MIDSVRGAVVKLGKALPVVVFEGLEKDHRPVVGQETALAAGLDTPRSAVRPPTGTSTWRVPENVSTQAPSTGDAAALEGGPYRPDKGQGQGHGHTDRQHFPKHDAPAPGLAESRQEGKAPGQFPVDDMVHDEHDTASPEHFLQVLKLGRARMGLAIDAGGGSLDQRYNEATHIILVFL